MAENCPDCPHSSAHIHQVQRPFLKKAPISRIWVLHELVAEQNLPNRTGGCSGHERILWCSKAHFACKTIRGSGWKSGACFFHVTSERGGQTLEMRADHSQVISRHRLNLKLRRQLFPNGCWIGRQVGIGLGSDECYFASIKPGPITPHGYKIVFLNSRGCPDERQGRWSQGARVVRSREVQSKLKCVENLRRRATDRHLLHPGNVSSYPFSKEPQTLARRKMV